MLRRRWLMLVFIPLLAGCQPVDSFNPLYSEKEIVFDPSLLGKWTEKDGTLEFFQNGDNAYGVTFADDNTPPERMVLTGRLVNLGGYRFLDLVQKHWAADPASYVLRVEPQKLGVRLSPSIFSAGDGAYLILKPIGMNDRETAVDIQLKLAHWFFRVTNDNKDLTLTYLDDEKLNKAIERKTVQIEHILVGPQRKRGGIDVRRLALTASTADLQKFLLDRVNDDQLFADSIKFKKQ